MPKPRIPQVTWEQPITTQTAVEQLGKAVAAVMESAAQGYTDAIKHLTPGEIKWSLGCQRAEDPEHETDPENVLRLLVANSKFFLLARGKDPKLRFTRHEELFAPPPLALEYLKQHSHLICNRRIDEDVAEDGIGLDEPLPLYAPPIDQDRWHRGDVVHNHIKTKTDLAAAFDRWVKEHPKADKRLLAITRTAITYLVQSGEGL